MNTTPSTSLPEGVILLHGILRTHRSMERLANRLKKHGYRVLNVTYPSAKHNLQALAENLEGKVAAFSHTVSRVHFIGFSMGGLLIRTLLHRYRPQNLGRVVMMGTPNQGSEVADFFHKNWLYYRLFGPAGQQLATQQEEFKHIFGTVDYELGILAGNRSIDFMFSRLIREPNDGKVAVESTKVEGMKDHLVIPVTHTFFPVNKTAWEQAIHFLNYGRFYKI